MYHGLRKVVTELYHRNACIVKLSFKSEIFLEEDNYSAIFYMNDNYNPAKDFQVVKDEVDEILEKYGVDSVFIFEEQYPYVLAIIENN